MEKIQMKVYQLIQASIEQNVSDIHFNIRDDRKEILFRSHKKTVRRIIDDDALHIFNHLKYLARFDLSQTVAQTGVFTIVVDFKEYYIRFAAVQSFDLRSGVVRILNLNAISSFEQSVYRESDRNRISHLLSEESGIIVFTGRTGSGKSTTLFNCVSSVKGRQVYSLENPVERYNSDWIQIEVKSYVEPLTQLLRHDPDIVILGEIRSEEDVGELIRAGLSGHLVVATMHAGSLIQALRRLMDLGASIYDMVEILKGIVYQEMKRNQDGEVIVEYEIAGIETIKRLLDKTAAYQ
ncbi:Flp pilus assembly complex ATPase component TadA [Erysipelothrix sp. HDW6C]|uniref:ATPase, T2SS/T4P/T4SS family n=1 Tax=Erysipelothrix sp. HDW6C TaxID=2714930 RepID=UPI00140ABD3E|nr:ATPase, T2SS/T4P/T4SS family [Erysipelothrix sp. HDW6C]QIK70156.1 Flp pilus assembly complex ATPase component TadA [Erysipelothrix sp. HDW6C]